MSITGHEGGSFSLRGTVRTVASIAALAAAGGAIYEGYEVLHNVPGWLLHKGEALVQGIGHDIGIGAGAIGSLATHGSIRSPWRPHINVPMQNTISGFQWPKFTPAVQAPNCSSGKVDDSKTNHTWGWDVVYNNTIKHGNHEKAYAGITEIVRINVPQAAIISAQERIYPHATPTHAYYLDVKVNGDALTTEPVGLRPIFNDKNGKPIGCYGSKAKPGSQQAVTPESYSTDGLVTRGENFFTDNAGDGARTTGLQTLVAEYAQVDSVKAFGHRQLFMQYSVEQALHNDLDTTAKIVPKNAEGQKITSYLRQLAGMHIQVDFVNGKGQPIQAWQIQYPWPKGMGAHPIAKFGKENGGYSRRDVKFTMIGTTTLSNAAVAQAAGVERTYKIQENG